MSYVESVRDKLRKITLVWIIDNQLGRRNLLPYVQGELELRKKPLIAAKAKENQLAMLKQNISRSDNVVKTVAPLNTRAMLAKSTGVSGKHAHVLKFFLQPVRKR